MSIRRFTVLLCALGLVAGAAPSASAHGLIGQRFFPATLAIDDPFVADELSLPTVLHIRNRGSDDSPPTLQTDLSGELSKRLSPNLGLSLGGTYTFLDPIPGQSTSGFDNMEVSLKYVFWQSAGARDCCSRPALGWDVGGHREQEDRRGLLRHGHAAALLRQGLR